MKIIKRYLLFVKKFYFSILSDGFKRANYLRKKNILGEIGDNVYFYSRIFPSDPKLLRLKNNIIIATNLRFVNHDRVDLLLNGLYGKKYSKFYGEIVIGNNVFIGADSIILPGVKIGDNCIIGAGSIVSKDLESGYVYAGVPAKRVGNFDDFINKRLNYYKNKGDN